MRIIENLTAVQSLNKNVEACSYGNYRWEYADYRWVQFY